MVKLFYKHTLTHLLFLYSIEVSISIAFTMDRQYWTMWFALPMDFCHWFSLKI